MTEYENRIMNALAGVTDKEKYETLLKLIYFACEEMKEIELLGTYDNEGIDDRFNLYDEINWDYRGYVDEKYFKLKNDPLFYSRRKIFNDTQL